MSASAETAPKASVIYVGARTHQGIPAVNILTVVGSEPSTHRLEPLPNVLGHSPDDFEWGHRGSGATDLALSILVHALGDEERAERLYQAFKSATVARFGFDGFQLPLDDVLGWVEVEEKKSPRPRSALIDRRS